MVKEDHGNVVFLRKIIKGGTDKSYGIHVAQMAGIPKQVISRSDKILRSLSNEKKSIDFNSEDQLIQEDQTDIYVKFLDKIKSIDPNKISPLEGLMILNEIIDEANDI